MIEVKSLTLARLKEMKPGEIIAHGEVDNSPDGVFMTRDSGRLHWVAQRGNIHDWTIYIHWADHSLEYVLSCGDKVMSEKHIKKLVPCDAEAFKLYRY